MLRTLAKPIVPTVFSQTPPSLPPSVLDLCLRLRDGIERVARERADEMVEDIFAAAQGLGGPRLLKRQIRQADRELRRLLTSLGRQLLHDLEQATRANVREAVRQERLARAQAAAAARANARAAAAANSATRRRPRRQPVRPLPPPPDPHQLKRDAETRRLRALLRPVDEEFTPLPPAMVVPPPAPAPPPAATPGALLRALEREIQDGVPGLAGLSPERCGAQIAAWTGQVREFRDRLPAETAAAMRPAFRIFLEHLTELRTAMEASYVDALEPKWTPPSWGDYVEMNRARAAGRPPRLSADRQESYHRAMLRALVLPHRRKVPEQALAVIAAAAEFLPPDDGLLRSARRRHEAARLGRQDDAGLAAPVAEAQGLGLDDAPAVETSADASLEPAALAESETDASPAPAFEPVSDAFPAPEATPPSETEPVGESEFDQPWAK